jgi:hypothetical protein
MTTVRRALALSLLVALSACESSTEPPGEARLVIVGRLERGQAIEVFVVRGADSSAVLQAAVTFAPSDAAGASFSGNTFVLNRTGSVAVSVTLAGGETLTKTIDVAMPPTFVFDMVAGGNRDIYRAALDGADLERLTTDPGVDVDPTAARNTLVFTSYRHGNAELHSRGLASQSTETRLSSTGANETDPALSPDGLKLAYTRDDAGTPRVFVASGTNLGAVPLTANFGFAASVEGSPAWRFTSDSVTLMATALGSAGIFVSGAGAGSTPAAAAKGAGDSAFVEPSWSVDGKSIAFTLGAGSASRIAVLTRATNQIVVVTPTGISAGHPAFIADGRVVFTIFGTGGTTTLAWVDPAAPGVVHPIALSGTDPQHPAIIWP